MKKMYILICCLLVTCMLGACGEQKLADITEDTVSKKTKIQESFGKGSQPTGTRYAEGPWVYQGVIMTPEGGTFTNHPGIVDFKGHSYLFYHTAELPGGNLFHRNVCVAEFTYNEDGTIGTIEKCDGIHAIKDGE